MSHASRARSFSWSSALRDIKSDRAAVVPGLVLARTRVTALAGFRKTPLVVAGQFNRSAIMALGVAAAAPRPVELPLTALVPTVDFAGATMRELWAIREAANLMCEVSNAKTWQGCNRLPDHPSGAVIHNEAGKLMRWVSDAMCHVATAAQDEARRRSPESSDDRETRFAMLAVSVIDNDDPAETAAFARELLATVEA